MTDKEWQKRKEQVARELGWDDSETIEPEPDPRYTERHKGATPLGGDYSIAYYYDEDHNPCEKSKARHVNIVIYDKEGKRINEVYGNLD